MKNRILSALLVCSLLFSGLPLKASAAEVDNAYGELALTVVRPEANAETEFTAKLTNASDIVKTETKTLAAKRDEETVTITDIADGEYTLTVEAEGYISYTQQLNFDGRCVKLTLHNNASVNEGRDGTQNKFFGVMPIGDVNGDKVINDTDADLIVGSIGADYKAAYDLNGDKKVDLTDLAIVVRNEAGTQEALPEHPVSSKALAKAVKAEQSSGTNVTKGSLADLMDKTKTNTVVQLAPSTGSIGKDNPVELVLTTNEHSPAAGMVTAEAITITPPEGSQNSITAGTAIVEGTDEETKKPVTIEVPVSSAKKDAVYSRAATPEVTRERDGTLIINLGRRVAIKKVTIRVTATANQNNLAEIAKVEFLSDFSERIPEPQMSVPTVVSASNTESDGQGYKNLTVTWDSQPNVTGYEVEVSGDGYQKSAITEDVSYTFQGDSFNGTVKSFKDYTIRVRSVSGEWKSDWSELYTHTVTCSTKPPQPKSVTATGANLSLRVTWDCKFDAESFTLYYKESGADKYNAVNNLTASSYTLTNLKGGVKYTVYVVAHNRNGNSPQSANAEGMPTTATGVEMPKYKLLNTSDSSGMASTHITQISGEANKSYTIYKADGTSVSNTNAVPDDWNVLLDGQPDTYVYIPDWDSGVTYANFRGPKIQLDKACTMDTIRLAPVEGSAGLLNVVKIRYKDTSNNYVDLNTTCIKRYDRQNRLYLEIITEKPITTDYLEIRTNTSNYSSNHAISEVRLYEYDDLEDTVAALFADEMRTVLNDNVKQEEIQALINRTNMIDTVSGEYHPHKQTILDDLNYAMQLLKESSNTAKILTVDNHITATGSPTSDFAQTLSDYQPLGITAAAGDTIVVYVSDGKTAKGQNVSLKLVATQMHPEVTAWQSGAIQLKAGRNEITVPKIGSYAKEAGGPLYLQYTGEKGAKEYQVRVSGGTVIPVLHLDGVADANRTTAISAYLTELEEYVNDLPAQHNVKHATSENTSVSSYSYAATDCILNATEITMENMMFSLPATQVLAGLGSGDKVSRLTQAVKAMEQEINYFYQFKGMNKAATDNNAYPYTRLNIRYHQMFTGAFMYAGGKHIGIEYSSVPELFGTELVTTDGKGKKIGGQYSGWGISHEIGHCINSKSYQRVEVTNNVFAQLARTDETNHTFRTTYDKVYKAVATGTTGHTGDLAVQLAMYWQLHLAYDNDYTFKVYDTIEAQQKGLFYARLESYLRTPSKAPHPFTSTDSDQLFMQAACAAAKENILGFFKAWGFKPNDSTEAYAANFNKEGVKVRKIQYIDDNSRLYRIEGKPGMSKGTAVTAKITNAVGSRINGNQVTISLSNTNTNDDAMLGYEICRNGKMVAFVTAGTTSYTDIVTTENNKAFVYTVTGIDRLLNETETVALPEVKVCHDGAISKDGWTAITNMTSEEDTTVKKDINDPDRGTTTPGVEKQSAIPAAFDNNITTVYYGTADSGNNRPYVELNLGGVEQVTALKYTPVTDTSDSKYNMRLFGYKIETSLDGSNWTKVKEGESYTGTATKPDSWVKAPDIVENDDGSYTMYFNKQQSDNSMDPFMYTYDAAYVRLTATNMSALAIAELDVLGPTNDNVELVSDGFGKLGTDYEAGSYADGDKCVIPKDSVVFYGAYKGDPAYNVVLLKDQEGNTLDGSQLIFADVPKQGALGGTSDGRWFFWLEPGKKVDIEGAEYEELAQLEGLESVKAELYRVQDAQTLKGQRLTSTSLHMSIPQDIPLVNITADVSNASAVMKRTKTPEFVPASELLSADVHLTDTSGAYFGDTGAVLTTGTDAPVHWKNTTGSSIEYDICVEEESSVAAYTEIEVQPEDIKLKVQMNGADNLYQNYRAYGNIIEIYTVARHGSIGGGHVTGTISGLTKNASLTASRMFFLKENNGKYEADSIKINAKVDVENGSEAPKPESPSSSGSSGNSSLAPATNGSNATSDSSGNTKLTLSVEKSKDGTAFAVMSEKTANALISQAEKNNSKQVVITVDAPSDASVVSMSMPNSTAAILEEKTNAGLTVDVKFAAVHLDGETVGVLSERSKNTISVKAEKTDDAIKVSLQADGKDVGNLSGVTVSLSVQQTAGEVAVIVGEDGSETIVKKAVAVNGSMNVPITGSATIRIKDNSKVFSDSANHWAKDSIAFVSSRELFNGVSASEFAPNTTMTRAMLATVLYRLEDATSGGSQSFPDVLAGKWFTDAVGWATDKGIVQGDTQGRFNPDKPVTREQLATMLYRYADTIGADTHKTGSLERFHDKDKVSVYAQGAMAWAVGSGIVGGTTDGNLAPDGNATRAEVAAMLMRLVTMLNSK